MRHWTSAALAAMFFVAPGAALACRVPQPASEVVFYDLPVGLPRDLTILKVSFPASGPIYPGATLRHANVQAIVRGAYAGSNVKVLVDGAQSGGCRWATTSSKTGYIVGNLRKNAAGEVYFDPLYETVEQRRKRGGIQKADPPMVQPLVKPFLISQPVWVMEPTTAAIRQLRPAGKAPSFSEYGFRIRCGVRKDGKLANCRRASGLDDSPTWIRAAGGVAGLFQMRSTTLEGWKVEGGEVDLRIAFDPPTACLASQVCSPPTKQR